MTQSELPVLTKKDFESDQDVRWCPGCGDYSILAQTQKTMPSFGVAKEKIVFISGIGCSGHIPIGLHRQSTVIPTNNSIINRNRTTLSMRLLGKKKKKRN